jgi:DNA polymerase elongation subunit (family B)
VNKICNFCYESSKYAKACLLAEYKITPEEIAFTTRSSKDVEDYKSHPIQTDVIQQIREEQDSIKAGQKIRYIITDYS